MKRLLIVVGLQANFFGTDDADRTMKVDKVFNNIKDIIEDYRSKEDQILFLNDLQQPAISLEELNYVHPFVISALSSRSWHNVYKDLAKLKQDALPFDIIVQYLEHGGLPTTRAMQDLIAFIGPHEVTVVGAIAEHNVENTLVTLKSFGYENIRAVVDAIIQSNIEDSCTLFTRWMDSGIKLITKFLACGAARVIPTGETFGREYMKVLDDSKQHQS